MDDMIAAFPPPLVFFRVWVRVCNGYVCVCVSLSLSHSLSSLKGGCEKVREEWNIAKRFVYGRKLMV